MAHVRSLVKSRGLTALWVTHRLEELAYCDGAFLLEQGRVTDQGEPEPLKRRLWRQYAPPQRRTLILAI